jgi:hypothetical protein
MENFIEYCKDYILSTIEDFEGHNCYGSELGMTLTEEPNCNGTLTFSRSEAKNYLREWWDECGGYWDYEKDNFGENIHNPFDNPEAYMVCMVIEGVNAILANEPHIEESWNDELELTEEVIEGIKKYVEEFDGEIF